VGIPLFLAQAVGIAFYIAGFSESLLAIAPNLVTNMAALFHIPQPWAHVLALYARQFVGIATLVVLTIVAYISADIALKTQFVVMGLIALSLFSLFLGTTPPTAVPSTVQVIGGTDFWVVFAVIFPAVTGLEAGISMSGDLKDPARSLPRGTIAAVVTGFLVYASVLVFLWAEVPDRAQLADPMIVARVARWKSLIVLGIWAAALSSAMGCLLGAPRTLQAMARDGVIPRWLGRGFGKGNDPRIATAVTFLVGGTGIALGNINLIAPVLTMFFLTSYGLLNMVAWLEEVTGAPSWRPRFRIPWWLSFMGTAGCVAIMLMISPGTTFAAAIVAGGLYVATKRRKLRSQWGDIRRGIAMLIARHAIHALARRKPDERTWRPSLLVLSGAPTTRWYLIALADAISRRDGLITVATVVPEDTLPERIDSLSQTISEYLNKREVSAIVKVLPAETPLSGAQMLLKAYGYGPIEPNTLLLGETEQPENYEAFAELIVTATMRRQNLVIVREADRPLKRTGPAKIDIWWYGQQQNLGLMLALVHLMQDSAEWQECTVTLKTLVDEPASQAESKTRLDGFINRTRIDAGSEALVRSGEGAFADIRRHSSDATLVFMGMRAPAPGETLDAYRLYYRQLLSHTDGFPPTALVLAAQDTDFYAIFQQ